MNHLNNAGAFLSQAIFGFVLYIVLLRFWMQWVHANFRNPVGQMVISLSNPLVLPLRKLLPSIAYIDTATLVLAFVIACLKTSLIVYFMSGQLVISPALLLYSLGEVIRCSIYLFLAAIFIQIIASWVNPYASHPVLSIARAIAEPLLAPARRLIPSIAGIDFSPILVVLFLQLSLILIVAPLQG